MTHAEYSVLPGITASAIKAGAVSMLHMRHYLQCGRPDSDAMAWGRLIHAAVLTPGELANVAVWRGEAKRGKEWLAFKDAAGAREIVTESDLDALTQIAAGVRANRTAADLLAGCQYEHAVTWHRPAVYGEAKARFDAVKRNTVVDVKSARRIDQRSAESATFRYGYHLQMGWYCEGMAAAGLGDMPDAWLVYVETEPPYDCAVYKVGYDALQYGQREAVRIATDYRQCERDGRWPGVQAGAETIGLPRYLQDEELEGFDSDGKDGGQ